LVQEKYRGEKACDERRRRRRQQQQQQYNNNNNYNYALYGNRSVITDQTTYNNRPNTVTLGKTIKEAYSTAAATSNCHNLHSTIIQKLQKHKDLKVELVRIIKRSIKHH